MRVAFWFDFVSPYSHLALLQARAFEQETGARFELRPVVYGKLLDATGLVGPVEVESKRVATFADVLRQAHRLGVRLAGPPAHPFRSLEALRAAALFSDDPRLLDLCVALSSACWGEGQDLTRIEVLADVAQRAGFDASDLAARIAADDVKAALASSTAEALARGVFGVPTFTVGDELFWGQDRLPLLADHLAGRLPPAQDRAREMAARPRGAERSRRV